MATAVPRPREVKSFVEPPLVIVAAPLEAASEGPTLNEVILTAGKVLSTWRTPVAVPLEPSPATGAVRAVLRNKVGGVGPDRVVAPELAAAEALIRSGAVIEAAESATGALA